ncbi:MAG: helix-turn-helix transcriptional regulator [Alphaproteobacteria bacterium]|nr:helix-turn-helix transcriptional regulator [Alphaproteobacteria bacterium]
MTPQAEIALSDPTLIAPINAAKELFWRQGYDETSIEDVVGATGMNRYALYNAFGGKLELFLAVLENYFVERKNLFLTALSDPQGGPMAAIREVSEYCIIEMTDRGAGCLMCDVAAEVGRYDKAVSERVLSYLEEIRSADEMALTQAEACGELNPAISPKEGAALLIANMLGVGALARNGAGRRELLTLFNSCLRLLGRQGDAQGLQRKRRNPQARTVKQVSN